jgi:hypothetical protein
MQLLAPANDILYRVIDGSQKKIFEQCQKSSSLLLKGLPFYNNFGDNYTVIASADGYWQAGFTPVKLSPTVDVKIDLMLLPKNPRFDFSMASWDAIKVNMPFLASGADDDTGRARYEDMMQKDPRTLAALLNISIMLRQVRLSAGTPLTYLKQLIWKDMPEGNIFLPYQDRFYAYADKTLVSQIQLAAQRGEFAPVLDPLTFHIGATSSYKQIQFGEANVQLTFHENDTRTIDGTECVVVETDIDYYKDLAAHALVHVMANALSGSLTDPKDVYRLRWIAGRRAGVPEFNPPYTIVA